MKILSVAIPCYNSQDYMAKCIESLLPGGSDIEILVVDDGSKDETARIADDYEKNIRELSGPSIRKTAVTERLSMQASAMQPVFILRW